MQVLDLSGVASPSRSERLLLDSLLIRLFPLVPFLTRLTFNPSFVLSRRSIEALALCDASSHLRILEGLGYVPAVSSIAEEEPLVHLLRFCPNLEEFGVVGQGIDNTDDHFTDDISKVLLDEFIEPLRLRHLKTLTLLAVHSAPLMVALLRSPLLSLRKLTITPYDDISSPNSLTSAFLHVHGKQLRSLLLFTPKYWPTRLHPSPTTLLQTCPNLHHLSLETPLPVLTLLDGIPSYPHPLQLISIPRPTAEAWRILAQLLPTLHSLRAIRVRDVRWLRHGMSTRALEAGVQGEMREWKRQLNWRGIKFLDADWKESQ